MDIKELQLRKENLQNQLKEQKSLEDTYRINITNLSKEINQIKAQLSEIQSEKEAFNISLEERAEKINLLKSKIIEYKENKKTEKIDELRKKLKENLKKIESLKFVLNFSIFELFDKLSHFQTELVLGKHITKIYNDKKEELITKLEYLIDANLNHKNKLNIAFFYFKLLIRCDNFFNDTFFDNYFFKKISDKFTFHFLSDKETNRLDKPEWMFKFLKEELFDIFKFYLIFKKDFFSLLVKIEELIKIKIREIFIAETNQKKKLIWHFYDELILYINEINKFLTETTSLNKEYSPKFKENTEILLKIQEESTKERLSQIHKLNYKKWHYEYKMLTKETFHFCKRYGKLESKLIEVLIFLLTKIQEFYEMFVDEMRFSSKNEIFLLCEIYSQIEQYKYFLQIEENDLLISNTQIDFSFLHKTKNNFFVFNQQNFKIIKDLLSDEIKSKLKEIKNFNFVDENTVVNFVIDISNTLSLYKKCTSFSFLEKEARKMIDEFIFERIILKTKLTSEQSFKLKDLIKRLTDLFGSEIKLSNEGMKCLECIFDEKNYENDLLLYEKINKIYE